MDSGIDHFNYDSKHYDKYKFTLKLIIILTVSNLFPLEDVQKCQHCQLCVLRKNSHGIYGYVPMLHIILITHVSMFCIFL